MTTVIGLGYAARSGKDTAAQAIIEARGGEFDIRRYAFGDALKREMNLAAEQAGGMFTLYQLLIQRFPTANLKYDFDPDMSDPLCPLGKQRSMLQWWGTEYRRSNDAFYWIKRLHSSILADKPQFAILTDVRFGNELAYVRSMGGHTVKVTRIGTTLTDLALTSHSSETALTNAPWDYEISASRVEELKADAVGLFDIIVDAMRHSTDLDSEDSPCHFVNPSASSSGGNIASPS